MSEELNLVQQAIVVDRVMNVITPFIDMSEEMSTTNLKDNILTVIARDGSVDIQFTDDENNHLQTTIEPKIESYQTPDDHVILDLREGDYADFELFKGVFGDQIN